MDQQQRQQVQGEARMSRRDFSWFRMDGDCNLMVINSLLMFEGQLDFPALRATLEQRLPNYARFTQVVGRSAWGRPLWLAAPDFDLAQHVELDPEQGALDDTELHALLASEAPRPLASGRPLWHMRVIRRAEGGFAILFRLHHCITDGLGLVHVLKHLTDETMAIGQPPSLEWHPQHAKVSAPSGLLCSRLRRMLFWARISAQLGRLALLLPDRRSSLKKPLSGDKALVQLPPLSLNLVRSIAKRMNATINDVWVAAVAGALRAYLQERGEPAAGRSLRAAVTFNLRNKGDAFLLGNHFGLVAVNLPSDVERPRDRLLQTNARMNAIKASHQPHATMFFLTLTGYLPRVLQSWVLKLFTAKGSVVLTNVEGPPEPRYLAGNRLLDAICWVPQAGTMGVGFALMSYAGQIQISMFADRSQVEDPQRLMALVAEAFACLEADTRLNALADQPTEHAGGQPAGSAPVGLAAQAMRADA
ncbi:WS/DGAT domain-containing protein [Paucibacter sp. AS339]|uniref:WS/DGAT domain-containing protein n=1 Tax=Paucibacter hankyongi TaxID=3133434 RepID=UPI003095861B